MAEIEARHSIKVYLYDNPLTPEKNDFAARVDAERTLDIRGICRAAYTRGGADISPESMEHAVDLFLKEMGYQLCDGFAVNTGWFTATPTIRGVFRAPTETFDRDRHHILMQFTQGDLMRREISNVDIEILGLADASLAILQVKDKKTGKVNDEITPGHVIRVLGSKLKVAGDKPEVGVTLVKVADGSRVIIGTDDLIVNNPSELLILLPATLAPGKYRLEVVTQYGGNKNLKEARKVVFDNELTVK